MEARFTGCFCRQLKSACALRVDKAKLESGPDWDH